MSLVATSNGIEVCPGCGLGLPFSDGPTHAYIGASASCWSVYTEVLSREYQDLRYARVHQLTSDSYPAQHPGNPERRSIQSVAVHLIGLYLMIERGEDTRRADPRPQIALTAARHFHWLTPPASTGAVTVDYVLSAADPDEHCSRVREWSRSVWSAWSDHHEVIRRWARLAGLGS